MAALQNRIDFVAFVSARGANPNGDPLAGNMPRVDRTGRGEMSPECIKRKIRNRMQSMGYPVCVVSNDKASDGYASIKARVEGVVGKRDKDETADAYKVRICETFMDTRLFGGVFAWKAGSSDEKGDSIPVLGPVSIGLARSLDPVVINTMQITKSTNGEDVAKGGRGSDTMGTRHYVEFGVYRIEGSISVQAAGRTGMSRDDALVLKECLETLFRDDESSARPSGSMDVLKVYWFEHGCAAGNCTSAAVFRSVKAALKPGVDDPASEDDYEFSAAAPAGVTVSEFSGI